MTSFSQFLDGLSTPYRSFTPALQQTYSKILAFFETQTISHDFSQLSPRQGFENPTLLGVANRAYYWFPTHFFKFQDTLLETEKRMRESDEVFLLDRPEVTFIDLGAGMGAASAALLSIIEQFQSYLFNSGSSLDRIVVNLIAVDPVQAEMDTYEQFIGWYANRLSEFRISVNLMTICGAFPKDTQIIVNAIQKYQGHVLIIGMSNLINWIWNEADQFLAGQSSKGLEKLQSQEAEALKTIAASVSFDKSYIIGIATKNWDKWYLPEKLKHLLARVAKFLGIAEHIFVQRWSYSSEVFFANPQGSRYFQQRPTYSSKWFVTNLLDVVPSFANDKKFQSALSLVNLEVSWAKVRNYITYESLIDEVELKLFETNLDDNLRKISNICRDYCVSLLNIQNDLPYDFPKNAVTTRPRSLPRLEEQIAATAIILEFHPLSIFGLQKER